MDKYRGFRHAADGSIIRSIRFACWITKTTDNTRNMPYLIALPRQKWLRERGLTLRLYVIACLEYSFEGVRCAIYLIFNIQKIYDLRLLHPYI